MNGQSPILVVEDEIADALLLQRAFGRTGLGSGIKVLSDGSEAIDWLLSRPAHRPYPVLIILDLKLRKVDGHKVLERLKETDQIRRIPIVVLTSSSDPRDIAKAYDLGANSYIVKPVRASDLQVIVQDLATYWLGRNTAGVMR